MDMHLRRPKSQRRQKFLMTIDSLGEVAALSDVVRLPLPIESRPGKDIIASLEIRESANRIDGMDVPSPGRALPPPILPLGGSGDLFQQIRQHHHIGEHITKLKTKTIADYNILGINEPTATMGRAPLPTRP